MFSAEEKPKLSSGKNGAQIPVIHQMPTLDPEPEKKDEKQGKEADQDEKAGDGDNGKIVTKDNKENEVAKIEEAIEKGNFYNSTIYVISLPVKKNIKNSRRRVR